MSLLKRSFLLISNGFGKYYSITEAGRAYFLEVREEYRQISEGIERILEECAET